MRSGKNIFAFSFAQSTQERRKCLPNRKLNSLCSRHFNSRWLPLFLCSSGTQLLNMRVVQYTQTESNSLAWQSVSTPLVKCISLRGLAIFSQRIWYEYVEITFVNYCQWYDWYHVADLAVDWYTIGEVHLIKRD